MPNPLQAADVVGHTLRYSELGLSSATITGASGNVDLTAYRTAVPQTVVVLVRLSSGSGTLAIDTTADGTFASAAVSRTISGTEYCASVIDTDATNVYFNIRLSSAANMIVDRILVLPLAKLTSGEDWFNVRDGVMAVANTTQGDGSGTFTFTVSD